MDFLKVSLIWPFNNSMCGDSTVLLVVMANDLLWHLNAFDICPTMDFSVINGVITHPWMMIIDHIITIITIHISSFLHFFILLHTDMTENYLLFLFWWFSRGWWKIFYCLGCNGSAINEFLSGDQINYEIRWSLCKSSFDQPSDSDFLSFETKLGTAALSNDCVLDAKRKTSAHGFKQALNMAVQKSWKWSTSQHTQNNQVTTSTYLHVLQGWSSVETEERFNRHSIQSTWEQVRSFISHFRKPSYSIQIIHCTASSTTDFCFKEAIV